MGDTVTATDAANVIDVRGKSSSDSLSDSWNLSEAGEGPASTARNSYAKMKIAGHQ